MNQGAAELTKQLAKRGDQLNLARKLGTSAGVVSRWASGERTPTARFRVALATILLIPLDAWELPVPEQPTEGAA